MDPARSSRLTAGSPLLWFLMAPARSKLERFVGDAIFLMQAHVFALTMARMAIAWATVVMLGGFVSNLGSQDFRIISYLLLMDGARVFVASENMSVRKRQSLQQRIIWLLRIALMGVSLGLAAYRLSTRHVSNQHNYIDALKAFYSLIVIEMIYFICLEILWALSVVPVFLDPCKIGLNDELHGAFQRVLVKILGASRKSPFMFANLNLTDYLQMELPGFSSAEQQDSLRLLRLLYSLDLEAEARSASKEFLTCLFNLMTMKYPREIRHEAILLVADLAQYKEALETIRLVASDEERVTVIIKALYPVVVRDVLVLLEKLADGSGAAQNMFQVKLEVSRHGFEFLMNVLRSEDTMKSQLAKETLLSLHWNWEGETIFHDIGELFNIFLKEGLVGAGEVLCIISEFPWHKEMLQKLLLGDGDAERLQRLLDFVSGYYSMRILKNVCAGGNHYLGRTEIRAILDKIWQEKLVGIVKMLPDLQDRRDLFMAMTLFTSVVDSVGVPAASFSQDTKQRLIEKLQSTCKQIFGEIGPHAIDQVMKSGAEAARQEPVTLDDGILAVEFRVCDELFLYALVHFCSKLLEIEADSFRPLATAEKLAEYLRFISSTTPADEEEQLLIVLSG